MNTTAVDSPFVVSPFVIAVAPDSFKGSCTSAEAASAIAHGVRSVFDSAFGYAAEIRELPMADGGEGTLEALVAAWKGRIDTVDVTDALGRARVGRVGFGGFDLGSHSLAIIEAADANGLPAVADVALQPLDADSAGVGELVLAALDAGADEILLCLGGSATSDGGAGLMRALGARLLDTAGKQVSPGARGLSGLHSVDLTGIDPRAYAVRWRIACDVDNPLIGPLGAAAVFGPQKGATTEDVKAIDTGLAQFARVLSEASGPGAEDIENKAGLGAAGGLGLGPVALFDAELVPGAQLVSEAIGLPRALMDADLVFTGEGRLDSQSLSGKVVSKVLAEAGANSVASAGPGIDPDIGSDNGATVMVIAGSVELSVSEARSSGITAAFSIANGPASLANLQRDVLRLLTEAAAHASGAFLAGASRPRRF